MRVKGIDRTGSRRALHRDHIQLPAPLPWVRREDLVESVRHQDRHAILRRGRLHARSQVDVRGEIGGIDLVPATNGAFDGPAGVQTETHVQLKGLAVLALQAGVGAEGLELLVPLQGDKDFKETEQGYGRGIEKEGKRTLSCRERSEGERVGGGEGGKYKNESLP